MNSIVQTQGLTKIYSGKMVVDHVNMNIQEGDIYGFIGENGAGKSTFMKMLVGLINPNEGELRLFGNKNVRNERKKIGSVIETPNLYLDLTAYDNLKIFQYSFNTKKCDLKEILLTVGLKETGNKKVKNFSLGMKQRLAIGIALLGFPEFLILDEPINGLDPEGIQSLRELLVRLNRDRCLTILISSHILGELSKISTKYGILHQGRLVKEIDILNFKKERHEYVRIVADDIKRIDDFIKTRLLKVKREIISEHEINIYCEGIRARNIMPIIMENRVSINEIFNIGDDLETYVFKLMKGENVNDIINSSTDV